MYSTPSRNYSNVYTHTSDSLPFTIPTILMARKYETDGPNTPQAAITPFIMLSDRLTSYSIPNSS